MNPQFTKLVIEMREAQRSYFHLRKRGARDEASNALRRSITLEDRVDAELAKMIQQTNTEQLTLNINQ